MIASGVVVYVSCQPVDFRKGAASLMALVRDGGLDPFSGALHVFRSKRADRVRIVWWDGSGICLYSKILEDHSFCWSAISAARMRLDHAQLMASGRTGLEKDPSGQGQAAVIDGLKPACGKMNHAAGTVGKAAVFCALLLATVLPGLALPDDVDALKAMILSMARDQAGSEARIAVAEVRIAASEAEVARLKAVEKSANERIANLTSILKVLQRTQHGTRSERLRLAIDDEQASFAFEEVETGLSEIRSELDRAVGNKPKRASRPRKGFAAHLERIEEIIEPEIPADCAGLEKVLIGEDRSERLDVVPPKFRVIVTRRPKYAFRGRDGVVQALARRPTSLKAACRRSGCSPISPSRNTPMAFRFTGRRRSIYATVSRSAGR